MKTFHIIRHGAPEEDTGKGNLYSSQAKLSELGHKQVDALVAEYKKRGIIFDRIYVSPLPRALITASKLPKNNTELIVVEDLREPDWGELVGKPFASFPLQSSGNGYDLYFQKAGQEPFSDVVKRVKKAYSRILQDIHYEEHIAVVSHGVISKLGMHLLKTPHVSDPTSEHDLPDADQLAPAHARLLTVGSEGEIVLEETLGKKV